MATYSESFIIQRPPNDGREWDNQCARCGSSVDFFECEECDGMGYIDCNDDYLDPEMVCQCCGGRGGLWLCLSTPQFCLDNPLPGREHISPGAIEWFTFEPPRAEE